MALFEIATIFNDFDEEIEQSGLALFTLSRVCTTADGVYEYPDPDTHVKDLRVVLTDPNEDSCWIHDGILYHLADTGFDVLKIL